MGRRKSLDEKLSAIRRVEGGEGVASVAASVGVSRVQLYRWRRVLAERGVSGLEGRGRRRREPSAPDPGGLAQATALERVAALERKVAQQALELDFFKTALQHAEASRRASSGPGGTASTPGSGRGRGGKAGTQD